jgi:hypothetical protein
MPVLSETIVRFRTWVGREYGTTIQEEGDGDQILFSPFGEDGDDFPVCQEVLESLSDLAARALESLEQSNGSALKDDYGNCIVPIVSSKEFMVYFFGEDDDPEIFCRSALQEMRDLLEQVLKDTEE